MRKLVPEREEWENGGWHYIIRHSPIPQPTDYDGTFPPDQFEHRADGPSSFWIRENQKDGKSLHYSYYLYGLCLGQTYHYLHKPPTPVNFRASWLAYADTRALFRRDLTEADRFDRLIELLAAFFVEHKTHSLDAQFNTQNTILRFHAIGWHAEAERLEKMLRAYNAGRRLII